MAFDSLGLQFCIRNCIRFPLFSAHLVRVKDQPVDELGRKWRAQPRRIYWAIRRPTMGQGNCLDALMALTILHESLHKTSVGSSVQVNEARDATLSASAPLSSLEAASQHFEYLRHPNTIRTVNLVTTSSPAYPPLAVLLQRACMHH